MKRLAVILVVIVITASAIGCMLAEPSVGFQLGDLTEPEIIYADGNSLDKPLLSCTSSSPVKVELNWSVTSEVFVGAGGALWLNIRNNHPGDLYVYGFGLEWVGGGRTERECDMLVPMGEERQLGLLIFHGPESPGDHYYCILLKLTSKSVVVCPDIDEDWCDHGEVRISARKPAEVVQTRPGTEPMVRHNSLQYYRQFNSLVNSTVAANIVGIARENYPGNYNILQVVDAFEWVRTHIEYLEDIGGDYWQSAEETMTLRTGDCEDQAILLASAVCALGGSARINVIEGHAFPTVFIGTTAERMGKIDAAIASYYGVRDGQVRAAYLVDDTGYWLVIDTTGFPYAGGIPANSYYSSADRGWSLDSDYLYMVDITEMA